MSTTIRDIARALNVSHTTVSRVLNGQGGSFISAPTRERVLHTAREMNYRPNAAARALATGRHNTIALWIGPVYYPYFSNVMHQVELQLRRDGFDMVYVAGAHEAPDTTLNQAVDGILAVDRAETLESFLERAPADFPPVVSLGCYSSKRTDFVHVDLFPGAYTAVQHLARRPQSRILYVSSGRGDRSDDDRYRAYHQVIAETGRQPECLFVPEEEPASIRAQARAQIRAYLHRQGCPGGIFCFNDELAIGVQRGLYDCGVQIPEQVEIVGCDGIEDTEYHNPPLSTIVQPYDRLCEIAWQFLKARMQNPDLPQQTASVRAEFVPRASVGKGE